MQQTLTNTQYLLTRLGATYTQYDNLRHVCYLNWCIALAQRKNLPLRHLTAHPTLLAYYHDLWDTCVLTRLFAELGDLFEQMTEDDFAYYLTSYADELKEKGNYPAVLLRKIAEECTCSEIRSQHSEVSSQKPALTDL